MFEVGVAKKDITCSKKGVGMVGYGMFFQKVRGVETPLMTRAFVFRDQHHKKIAFISAEIWCCTIAVKKGVIKRLEHKHSELGFDFRNVMITGTHTHSGPGGYSHYGFYNMSIPGFVPEVYTAIVDGIVDAIIEANENLQPAKISIGKGIFPQDQKVAFNRSIKAYNKNKGIKKVAEKDNHLAIDRTMTLLRFDDSEGKPIGSINWFGVHTTSVGNDLNKICADNKGYAADFLEAEIGEKYNTHNFVSAFAQAPCGDVSPNFIWDKKRNKMRGASKNDYENARENGRLQFKKALEIFENCEDKALSGTIDFERMNIDFSNIAVDPIFSEGISNQTTSPACMGVSFFEGTTDGMGVSKVLGNVVRGVIKIQRLSENIKAAFDKTELKEKIKAKYAAQGVKSILMETSERKILGTTDIEKALKPIASVDKSVKHFIRFYKNGSLGTKPWTPNILPLQIIILGELALVGMPGEPTTIAGKRIKKLVLSILKKRGISEVIISPYANAFSGYITTNEEYQAQCYEGGHTMYGQWTLGAYLTKFKQLAEELLKPDEQREIDRSIEPAFFTNEELELRTFEEKHAES